VLAVGTQDEWLRFCQATGLDELSGDARFADGFRRWKNRDALHEIVRDWAREQEPHAAIARLQANGVAASLCYRMDHVLSDEHLRQRGALYQADYGRVGQV